MMGAPQTSSRKVPTPSLPRLGFWIGFLTLVSLLCDTTSVVNIEEYGASSGKDSTDAIQASLRAASSETGGGEVLVPPGKNYYTAPIRVSSNTIFRIDGNLTALANKNAYPIVDILPSYDRDLDAGGAIRGRSRYQPLIWVIDSSEVSNVTLRGTGTVDGSGSYWIEQYHANNLTEGRPHLVEVYNGTNVTITIGPDLTLLNSAFWTLHPIYCTDLHVHGIRVIASECSTWNKKCNPNIDGIDVDSSQNVLIENNYISVGDDHVTVLSGRGRAGVAFNRPSRNVTVINNLLGTGMGLSIGSSVSGGVEDVIYANNIMSETREQWGQGVHVKTRLGIGGYIRNIVWDSNDFVSTGTEAIIIEAGYQSSGSCDESNCTVIKDIVLRNLTFHNASRPGRIVCSSVSPCTNITFDRVM